MKRAVVNVSTGRFVKGQERLSLALDQHRAEAFFHYWTHEPDGCPPHAEVPYAFKAYALKHAAKHADLLLWCDASILPIRSLEPIWQRLERDGYWISNNGFSNAQWTADSAYEYLLPEYEGTRVSENSRITNRKIPHVVATAFGLNIHHPTGAAILAEYYRLASETKAFCGPWKNTPETPCGPPEVLGHRHDQTALSVLAWRNGCALTNPPEIFAYHDPKKAPAESTILLAHGGY